MKKNIMAFEKKAIFFEITGILLVLGTGIAAATANEAGKNTDYSIVYFQIDDVYSWNKNTESTIIILLDANIPITLSIIPGILKEPATANIIKLAEEHPGKITIVQHGWKHKDYLNKGHNGSEFPQSRGFDIQFQEIKNGNNILEKKFGKYYSKIFVPPYLNFSDNTIIALKRLDFIAIVSKPINKAKKEKIEKTSIANIQVCARFRHYETSLPVFEKEIDECISKFEKFGILIHPMELGIKPDGKKELIQFVNSIKNHKNIKIESIKQTLRIRQA